MCGPKAPHMLLTLIAPSRPPPPSGEFSVGAYTFISISHWEACHLVCYLFLVTWEIYGSYIYTVYIYIYILNCPTIRGIYSAFRAAVQCQRGGFTNRKNRQETVAREMTKCQKITKLFFFNLENVSTILQSICVFI